MVSTAGRHGYAGALTAGDAAVVRIRSGKTGAGLSEWRLRYSTVVRRFAAMSSTGLAIFVFLAFLIPVPILAWLDRPRSPK